MKFLELLLDDDALPDFFEKEKMGGQSATLARLFTLENKAEQSKRTVITQNFFMVDDL
ncbi:hypothetical protein [Parafilimonas sp.]|uniref:hypothetical protein n=1 Tax=Parafilimonas sp. TaxID=1969739 RepID=UPI0039E46008